MADDADAADQVVNKAIGVLTRSDTRFSESADSPTDRDLSSGPADTIEASEERDAVESDEPLARNVAQGFRIALALALAALLALTCLGVWLGYNICQARRADTLRNQFLAVGKQGALNLTTINYVEADADVQRIVDSSTGQFRDEFSKHAPAFVDVVKQAQSKTQGSITEAGVESLSGDSARVLVAVAVNSTEAAAPDQPVRHWRMRIDLQKVGDTVKVSNVGFVP